MAAWKNQQQEEGEEAVVVAATEKPSVARRLWRVVRAVLYMLRRGLPSGRKLAMDLHLLLHRGKIAAGKALGDRFLASHHGFHNQGRHAFSYAGAGAAGGPFSCGTLDPSLAVHEPSRRRREVEFSCSNTPSSASGGGGGLGLLGAARRRHRLRRSSTRHQQQQQQRRHELDAAAADGNGYLMQYYYSYDYDAAEVARVFEMLSDNDNDDDYDDRRLFSDDAAATPAHGASSSATTPSPAQAPHVLRQLAGSRQTPRIIAAGSSPADGGAAQVDRRADEFIRRFYEQLRAQRSAASTPDYYGYAGAGAGTAPGASPYAAPRSPRPVTAGIA